MTNTGTQPGKSRKPVTPPLTEAQAKLVTAVHALRLRNGVAPSYEELMAELSLSKVVVAARVKKLVERKMLRKAPARYRNLFVTRAGHKALAAFKLTPPVAPSA